MIKCGWQTDRNADGSRKKAKKLTVSRKKAKILTVNRKSHDPIETLLVKLKLSEAEAELKLNFSIFFVNCSV